MVVGEDDIVYHLGDFGNWKWDDVKDIYARLNGNIILIKGSHDHHSIREHITWVPYLTLNIGPYHCLLHHKPIWEFRSKENRAAPKSDYDSEFSSEVFKSEKYDFVLCGHCHDLWKIDGRNINLSVENIGYKPLSELGVLSMISRYTGGSTKTFISGAAPVYSK